MAASSSLDSAYASPRTSTFRRSLNQDGEDDVELSLLTDEQRNEANGYALEPPASGVKRPMSAKDKRAVVLLCLLCECSSIILELAIDPSQTSYRVSQCVSLFFFSCLPRSLTRVPAARPRARYAIHKRI
jgi:hypothetical protein